MSAAQADTMNRLVRAIDVGSGAVTTLAGQQGYIPFSDGVGSAATFNFACGITMNSAGSFALVVGFFACVSYLLASLRECLNGLSPPLCVICIEQHGVVGSDYRVPCLCAGG
jgi:hypothetical protein